MLGFMSERLSSWEKIKQSGREVVVYGMGNGADKALISRFAALPQATVSLGGRASAASR